MYAPSSSANPLNREALRPPECFLPRSYSANSVVKSEDSSPIEPILIDSRSPSPEPRSSTDSRQRLFAAIESGELILRDPRPITSADDLDEFELKRCFEILHACGVATDPAATLGSTRDTMEDFLDAIFKDWSGNSTEDLAKPTMDFVVRDYVSVGIVCDQPTNHRSLASCADSLTCETPVYGVATYRSRPAQLGMGFSTDEPSRNKNEQQQDLFCPMERPDVRWDEGDWLAELRHGLKRSCTGKIHKYNKHLAIWYVRCLVSGWAEGSISMGTDGEVLAFVGEEAVDAAFAMMGDDQEVI
ncbi:hypothetical protein NW762_013612 [Fusarium torreyae]|uniref:Uncharacterized protein n=1 Tax=Fusarium torreyae TaxID=1237075 RepID=A0A9W8RN40_9HYPO|nr:hypothetical protein NW762_013612 [Fusarium torreyae]